MSDDEGPPPLDDFTEQYSGYVSLGTPAASSVNAVKKEGAAKREVRHMGTLGEPTSARTGSSESTESAVVANSSTSAPKQKKKKPRGLYSGFKPGFLLRKNAKKQNSKPKKPAETYVEGKSGDGGVLGALQNVRQPTKQADTSSGKPAESSPAATAGDGKGEVRGPLGVVDDKVLKQFVSNDELRRGIGDPEVMAGVELMKTNPQEALKRYGKNKKFMTFLQSFMGMMGGSIEQHAKKLSEGQQQQQQQQQGRAEQKDKKKKETAPPPSMTLRTVGKPSRPVPSQPSSYSHGGGVTSEDMSHNPMFQRFGQRWVHKALLQRWMANPQIRFALNHPATAPTLAAIARDRSLFLPLVRKMPTLRVLVQAGVVETPPECVGKF